MRVSLTARLVGVVLVMQSLLLAAVAGYLFIVNPPALIRYVMHQQLELLSDNVAFDDSGKPYLIVSDEPDSRGWVYQALPNDLLYQLIDEQGRAVFSSAPVGPFTPAGRYAPDGLESFHFTLHQRPMYVERKQLAGDFDAYRLQVAASERMLELSQFAKIEALSKLTFGFTFLSISLYVLIVILTVRRMLKPLLRVAAAAQQISPDNLRQRLPAEAAPKELKAVIRVVNDAFQRLEKGFQIQQDMLATTAHELKTPLTLMRNEVEALDPIPARQLLLNDIDQLSRQVGQILHLSEARGVQNYQFIECDVVELADDVVRYLARLADSHQVQLQLQFNERVALVRADKGMLFVLLKNLVENAIYHAEPQTAVCIDLREHQHPDTEQHILTVSNKGPAITAEHRRLIFNKFWRGPERHHVGAGLGLSICQEIAEKHGWRLRVTNHATRTLFVLYSQPLRLKNQ